MPIKISENVTYTIELKIEALEIDVTKTINADGLKSIYRDLDSFCTAIADQIGALRMKGYTSPAIRTATPKGEASIKLLEYAGKVTDFTIRSASEATGIPEATLYTAAINLVKAGTLTKQAVAGGIAHIYALAEKKKKIEEKVQTAKIAVLELPEGKLPFPTDKQNPEKEKMQFLRG